MFIKCIEIPSANFKKIKQLKDTVIMYHTIHFFWKKLTFLINNSNPIRGAIEGFLRLMYLENVYKIKVKWLNNSIT